MGISCIVDMVARRGRGHIDINVHYAVHGILRGFLTMSSSLVIVVSTVHVRAIDTRAIDPRAIDPSHPYRPSTYIWYSR